MENNETINLLVCRNESSVPISIAYQENVRWYLRSNRIRSRVQYGGSEGRGTLAASSTVGGETMRSSLHRQRGLLARHCHSARL